MNDCIFCKIAAGEIPAEKIYENDKVIAFLDNGPVHAGHTLVIPKKHFENLSHTDDEFLREMIVTIKKIAPKIVKAVEADGFNMNSNSGGAAGQIIFHTHFHIIPRYSDDGLRHWGKTPYKDGEMAETAQKIRKELSL